MKNNVKSFKKIAFIILSFWVANGWAQANKPVLPSVDTAKEFACVYTVEPIAEFEGGQKAMFQFLSNNLKFPKDTNANRKGTVFVGFVVNSKGEITNVEVKRGLTPRLNEEAIRVVKLMNGKWKPGKRNGQPEDTKFTLPIKFSF